MGPVSNGLHPQDLPLIPPSLMATAQHTITSTSQGYHKLQEDMKAQTLKKKKHFSPQFIASHCTQLLAILQNNPQGTTVNML
jgi:hypothetical protein